MGGSAALRRVALVCPYSWSYPGGVQSHVRGLAGALRAEGVEVDVFAPTDGAVACADVVSLGRTVSICDNGSVQHVALSPAAAARTARLLRARGYDVVHVHEPMIPLASLTALFASRAPLVGTFHMYAPLARWYRLFAPLCRSALARLRIRIAVSEAARAHVARVCPGDYEIVPNGVDALPTTHEHRGLGRTIVFVGRAEPRKGLRVLLDALRLLPSGVQLQLVGVGADELARTLEGAAIDPRVEVCGYVGEDERTRRLLAADVLCAPSLAGESFGVVLAEAMAAGVPVVASDVAGYRELLARGRGVIVPRGDPTRLAAALRDVLAAPALRARLAATAREHARTLAWPRVAARVLDLYERALT